MFCRDTDLPVVPLDDLVAPFQAITYKSKATQAKAAAPVYGFLSVTSHTSKTVKIKSEAFVVIIGKNCFDLLTDLLRKEPWGKKEKPLFKGHSFVLLHGQSSEYFSSIHGVALVECFLNGYMAHVRIDLGAPDA
jgi:hypothetical protein